MSDINIKETTNFDSVTSFLDSSLTKLGQYSEKLASIGSGLTGELLSEYNKAANPVKSKIASIESAIAGAKGHISNALNVLDFNKDAAKQLVSEGILDYKYASGSNNDLISFRLSHISSKKM